MQTVAKPTSKSAVRIKEPAQVLHIIKSLGRGGAETLLPETLSKHDKKKYQFHYIYFLPWKNQMVNEIEQAGGKVSCLPAKNILGIVPKVPKIITYIKQHKIKLIHCHLPWGGIIGRIVGKITNIPVIYTEHNQWERYHKITYYLNKLSFSSQKKVIAVSEEVAKSIKARYRKNNPSIQVIQNGINTEKFSNSSLIDRDIRKELNISAESIVIGVTCVFRKQKRLIIWIEIAKELHDKNYNTHFIIVGDGVMRDEIHEKALQLKTEEYIHFVGLQAEIRPYLKAMNIFMMTSEYEGLPIALLEAMSMGCMPACTNAGGISELIEEGLNGIIVPVNKPMQLIKRLSEYVQHPSKIAILGQVAKKTIIDNFSLKRMVSQLETIYDNFINQ
ncbi:MAG: glycosyltransferase [Parafilimonas sp.]